MFGMFVNPLVDCFKFVAQLWLLVARICTDDFFMPFRYGNCSDEPKKLQITFQLQAILYAYTLYHVHERIALKVSTFTMRDLHQYMVF